jgi:hypothetical protein
MHRIVVGVGMSRGKRKSAPIARRAENGWNTGTLPTLTVSKGLRVERSNGGSLRYNPVHLLSLLVGVLLLPAVPLQAKAAATASCSVSAEDYALFSAVLLDRGGPEDPEEEWETKPEILISDETTTDEAKVGEMWGFRSKSKQAPSNETVANFNSHQVKGCSLKASLDPKIAYSLISGKEVDGYFKGKHKDGWGIFYAKHPKAAGYLTFSAVGYNSSGTEALVFLGHHCGWLCGTGHLYLLVKENGQWSVKNRLMQWIS